MCGCCLCKESFYLAAGGPGDPCIACPARATCAGGIAAPVSVAGAWASPASTGNGTRQKVHVTDCHPLSVCERGSQCAEGFTGIRCSALSAGYFSAVGTAESLPSGEEGKWCLSFGIPFALIVHWVCLIELASSSRRCYEALSVMILSAQCLSVVGRFALRWPRRVYQALWQPQPQPSNQLSPESRLCGS